MNKIDKKTGIWSIKLANKHKHDFLLAGAIGTYYSPKLFADVGCGDGTYCAVFKSFGWLEIHGYEGTPKISSLGVYDNIMTVDLSKKRYVDIKYDLVLCLEVGEHIPKEHEQVFIDNICEYTTKDLILSWAIPGQGGKGHYNEQSNDYVIDQFKKRNFKINDKMSRILRGYSSLKWFKDTIMVFRRK